MLGVATRLELDSPEPSDRVARLVRNAERGCFVMQGLLRPVPIQSATTSNGEPLPPCAREENRPWPCGVSVWE